MTGTPDLPVHLRPPERPRLVRLLNRVAVLGAVLALAGGPVWWFMHGTAQGWADERVVLVSVSDDAECRSGPPPGDPQTCEATWTAPDGRTVTGEVSDRYGGQAPRPGAVLSAREVRAPGTEGTGGVAFTGYQEALLRWALAAPYLAVTGGLLLLGAAIGLVRTDPRWGTPRTDLPQPGGR
ncbi:MAG TPA: hypothetical protein VGE77_09210 [Nocardioides sp.]